MRAPAVAGLTLALLAGCALPAEAPADLATGAEVVGPTPVSFVASTPTATYDVAGLLWLPASGNATTVLLALHGSAGYKENNWGAQPVPGYSLAERQASAGRALVAVDLPGYGDSPTSGPVTVTSVAQAIAAISGALRTGDYEGGPAFPVVVSVGHSMGSTLANEAQGSAGASFDGMVNTGWGAGGFAPEFHTCVAQLSLGMPCPRDNFYYPPQMDPLVWEHMNETLGGATPGALVEEAIARAERAPGGPSAQDVALANIDVPVLLVIGAEDWIFADVGNDPPRYPSAEVEQRVIPETGHFVLHHRTHEEPFAAIDSWLAAHGW